MSIENSDFAAPGQSIGREHKNELQWPNDSTTRRAAGLRLEI
jgi:hypothetical protein